MDQPLTNNFFGLQHIGIPVTDLERSRRFYTRLGFSEAMTAGFMENGEPGQCSMMERGEALVELYQLPAAALAEIRTRRDGHVDHIAFAVGDIQAAFGELKGLGFETIEPQPVFLNFWEHGCWYFAIRGPDGEKLEFNERIGNRE
jgi:catechol 2,3-dioxygenase-like lactoylglutathione lyase family enzyme